MISIDTDEARALREALELEYAPIERAHKKQWILDRLNEMQAAEAADRCGTEVQP